ARDGPAGGGAARPRRPPGDPPVRAVRGAPPRPAAPPPPLPQRPVAAGAAHPAAWRRSGPLLAGGYPLARQFRDGGARQPEELSQGPAAGPRRRGGPASRADAPSARAGSGGR